MKRVLTAAQMKKIDVNTSEIYGISTPVLIEKAAISFVSYFQSDYGKKWGIICGPGNNGADGVAIARLLALKSVDVKIYIVAPEEKWSKDLKAQVTTAKAYNLQFVDKLSELDNCNILVDAIFGIGLSRIVEGDYKEAIEFINNSYALTYAVDVPSGYNTDTGEVLGMGVNADITVCFSYLKKCLCLNECFLNAGQVVVPEAGIYTSEDAQYLINKTITPAATFSGELTTYKLEPKDVTDFIPERKRSANKGSHGKLVIIAGSEEIYGACYLSAKAALKAGAGYVKIYTHEKNLPDIRSNLPEAVCTSYSDKPDFGKLQELIDWADAVLIGPGLSTSDTAKELVNFTLINCTKNLVIDADALNIISKDLSMLSSCKANIIITPHLLEMSRLCDIPVADINNNMEAVALDFSDKYGCIVCLKNYVTVIAIDKSNDFINTNGNEGLAMAGSGDILSGIIASLLAQSVGYKYAAAVGAYMLGDAADKAMENKKGINYLTSEVLENI